VTFTIARPNAGKPENDEEFFDMTTEEGDIDPRGQVGKAL
jgi:hypothetical protein